MAISLEARTDLVRIVVGMFNGAPGSEILSQLTNAFEAGQTRLQIATNLAKTAEYQSLFPDNNTNAEVATKITNSLLGNLASAATKAEAVTLLTGMLNAKNTSTPALKAAARAEVTLWAIDALKNVAATDAALGAASVALNNKVTVASYYSVEAQQNPATVLAAQEVIQNVINTDASVTAAKAEIDAIEVAGQEYWLKVGPDTSLTGTSFNDTFYALSVNDQGAKATTLNGFDNIDGGNGTDTLNIYTDFAAGPLNYNGSLPAGATVKNVEIINVYNQDPANLVGAFGDASKFEGVEQLWQHAGAVAVTNLGAATTAGFKDISGGPALAVTPTATAASASVALSGIGGAATLTVNKGTALNAVNVAGSLATGGTLATNVTVGDAQTGLALNSAVATTLTATGTALVGVDASKSTGAITYVAGNAIRTIKSGTGADTLTLTTNGTADASVESGAGKDTVTINTTTTGLVTVSTGADDDTINLNSVAGKVNINAGAGNDVVVVAGGIDSVKTTDVIDGGEGTDTISVAGKNFDAEDYIILTEVIKNFETLRLTASAATVDASKLTGYTTFANQIAGTKLEKVAAGQAVTTTANITVSANGYVAPTSGNIGTLVGTLNVTSLAASTIVANAEVINLTVSPATSDNDGVVDTISTVLDGDLKTANITLVAKTDTNGTTNTTTDDVLEVSNITITTADAAGDLDGLTSITVSGNGTATITNGDATALATVDASGLASKNIKGEATAGLTYVTTNKAVAETITLGAGLDKVTITGSTFAKVDTVSGLTLVDDAATAGLQVDVAKSDDITVRSNDNSVALTAFAKTTSTAASLNLALVDLAASANNQLVFQYGGDTYIYADVTDAGLAGDGILNDSDILIKITGLVDLDLLVSALNA